MLAHLLKRVASAAFFIALILLSAVQPGSATNQKRFRLVKQRAPRALSPSGYARLE